MDQIGVKERHFMDCDWQANLAPLVLDPDRFVDEGEPVMRIPDRRAAVLKAVFVGRGYSSESWNQSGPIAYGDKRPDILDNDYEGLLHMKHYSFERFLRRLAGFLCKEKLKIFDFGSGKGVAVKAMSGMEVVDEACGLTLPVGGILADVREQIVVADAVQLAPRSSGRFDVVVSVLGAVTYHYLNGGEMNYMFGVLQAINYLELGGALLVNLNSDTRGVYELIREEILGEFPWAREFRHGNVTNPRIYRLLRRPSFEEIKKFCGVDEHGTMKLNSNFVLGL